MRFTTWAIDRLHHLLLTQLYNLEDRVEDFACYSIDESDKFVEQVGMTKVLEFKS